MLLWYGYFFCGIQPTRSCVSSMAGASMAQHLHLILHSARGRQHVLPVIAMAQVFWSTIWKASLQVALWPVEMVNLHMAWDTCVVLLGLCALENASSTPCTSA